jgi:hypothetical protein
MANKRKEAAKLKKGKSECEHCHKKYFSDELPGHSVRCRKNPNQKATKIRNKINKTTMKIEGISELRNLENDITIVTFSCDICNKYESSKKFNVQLHMKRKHGIEIQSVRGQGNPSTSLPPTTAEVRLVNNLDQKLDATQE